MYPILGLYHTLVYDLWFFVFLRALLQAAQWLDCIYFIFHIHSIIQGFYSFFMDIKYPLLLCQDASLHSTPHLGEHFSFIVILDQLFFWYTLPAQFIILHVLSRLISFRIPIYLL